MTKVQGLGFPVTRGREGRRACTGRQRRLSPPLWFWLLALAGLLWTVGATRAWPQNSGSSSSNSSSDLTTWELLSGRFRDSLNGQSTKLRQALTEMETSKANSQKLTILLEQSLQANESLKNYNEQIAQRMQERDEDLARAYEKIDRLEERNFKLIIAVIVMGVVIAGLIFFIVRR